MQPAGPELATLIQVPGHLCSPSRLQCNKQAVALPGSLLRPGQKRMGAPLFCSPQQRLLDPAAPSSGLERLLLAVLLLSEPHVHGSKTLT